MRVKNKNIYKHDINKLEIIKRFHRALKENILTFITSFGMILLTKSKKNTNNNTKNCHSHFNLFL